MLRGLYAITFEKDGRTIAEAREIESEDELPGEDDDEYLYFFGDSPKEGAMKTGTAALEIDGERYSYKFYTSGSKKGAGVNGIDDDCIYIQGRRMEAEDGTKYEPFEYKGEEYLINTSTLKSVFKAVYGQPIAAYMKEFRMHRAMELLRGTDMPISDIAAAVGYESAGKFTKAFQDVAHVLPSEYRKQFLRGEIR